jgi:hypothetical protein
MKLGYGEQEKESEKFVALHQFLSTDPGLSALYGPDKKYNMAKTIMEKAGIKNIDSFLMKPEELQPPQPDPMAVKQMELEERKVVTQEKVAENSGKKVEFNAQLESQRIEIDRLKYELEKLLGMQEAERKDFDVASKAAIAVQEMEIAKQAPDEQVRAIVSPN